MLILEYGMLTLEYGMLTLECGMPCQFWYQVGPNLAEVGPKFAQVSPRLDQIGRKLAQVGTSWRRWSVQIGKSAPCPGKKHKNKDVPHNENPPRSHRGATREPPRITLLDPMLPGMLKKEIKEQERPTGQGTMTEAFMPWAQGPANYPEANVRSAPFFSPCSVTYSVGADEVNPVWQEYPCDLLVLRCPQVGRG